MSKVKKEVNAGSQQGEGRRKKEEAACILFCFILIISTPFLFSSHFFTFLRFYVAQLASEHQQQVPLFFTPTHLPNLLIFLTAHIIFAEQSVDK